MNSEYDKKIEKAKAAQKRRIEKQIAKQRTPEYQEKQRLNKKAAIERQRNKALDKIKEKKSVSNVNPPAKKSLVITKSRKPKMGLKGRNPTLQEKRVMNSIAKIGCIACLNKGRERPLVSLHHISGRVKKGAHFHVLPLCAEHHDTPADKSIISQYPDLIPIHAKGKIGGKGQWHSFNGTELELMDQVFKIIGFDIDAFIS